MATFLLPPLNPLHARSEAAARHLSFKLAAHELHVTQGAVSQQVKTLEDRLGVRLFERLHRQLMLTSAGRDYAASVRGGLARIADATARLQPPGVAVVLVLGVHARFDLGRGLAPDRFRAANPTIGLRIVEPAGLHELTEGKVDALVDRSLGHHPGYRCDRLQAGSDVGDYLICPEGTADCAEIDSLRVTHGAAAGERVGRFPRVTVGGHSLRLAVSFSRDLRSVNAGDAGGGSCGRAHLLDERPFFRQRRAQHRRFDVMPPEIGIELRVNRRSMRRPR